MSSKGFLLLHYLNEKKSNVVIILKKIGPETRKQFGSLIITITCDIQTISAVAMANIKQNHIISI